MATITFSDGTSMEVLNCISGQEYMLGSERDFLNIIFDGDTTEYADVKALYENTSIFSYIQYTVHHTDDSMATIDYANYNIPVNIISESKNGIFTITLKMAKKTLAEEAEEKLTIENEEIQMALIELAQNYAELEERLKALEPSDSTTEEV